MTALQATLMHSKTLSEFFFTMIPSALCQQMVITPVVLNIIHHTK